jgi:hypothetical protein
MRAARAMGGLQPARRCHRPPRVDRSVAVARRGATAMIRPGMTAAAVGKRAANETRFRVPILCQLTRGFTLCSR